MRLPSYIFVAVYWLVISTIAEGQQSIITCKEAEPCVIDCQEIFCGEAGYINAYNATNLLVLCDNDQSKCYDFDILCPHNQKEDNFCQIDCTVDNACNNINLLKAESNLININCARGIESCTKITLETDNKYKNTVNIVCHGTVCDGMNIIAQNYESYFSLQCRGGAVCDNVLISTAQISSINVSAYNGGEIYDSEIILNEKLSLKMDFDSTDESNAFILKRHYLSFDLAVFGDFQSIEHYLCQFDNLIESEILNTLYTIEDPVITISGYYDPNKTICSHSNSDFTSVSTRSTRRRLGAKIKKFLSYVPNFLASFITNGGNLIGGIICTVAGAIIDKGLEKLTGSDWFKRMSKYMMQEFKQTALYRWWVALPEIAQNVFTAIGNILKAGFKGAAKGAVIGATVGKTGGFITGVIGGGCFGPFAPIAVPLGVTAGTLGGILVGAATGATVGFTVGMGKAFISVVGTVCAKQLKAGKEEKYLKWEMSKNPEVARKMAIGLMAAGRKAPEDKVKKFGYYWMHSELEWDQSQTTFADWVHTCLEKKHTMTKNQILYAKEDHTDIVKYLKGKEDDLHYMHKDIEMMMVNDQPAGKRPNMYYTLDLHFFTTCLKFFATFCSFNRNNIFFKEGGSENVRVVIFN